ncbi:hypothetical protein TSUD_74610 [Trifolium subterraneum]|nr:hypothetical protein TSUD_74610 [Trifolium subterraneum]
MEFPDQQQTSTTSSSSPSPSSSSSSSSLSLSQSSSSCSLAVSSSDEPSTPDDLGEIVELPALGTSFELPDPNNMIFSDPVDGSWTWYNSHSIYDERDYFKELDQISMHEDNSASITSTILCGYEGSLWQH